MSEVQIVTPQGMFGAYDGEHPLETAVRIIGVAFGDDGDWCSKYGADYENDVFLMKRFCWCDGEGECPWCTGCGAYEDHCEACKFAYKHADSCFQKELRRRLDKHKDDEHDRITKDLYIERGREPTLYRRLCDCGSEEAGKVMRVAGKGCDYDQGRGIFSRFAPYQHIPDRRYYDPPNFWFKPSDFRMTWYKYIGRDTATNKDEIAPDFMGRIFATHPRGMTVEQAVAEWRRREEESAASLKQMFESLNVQFGAS